MTGDEPVEDGADALPDADGLAGVVDLFGALTGAELIDALSELAFRRGAAFDEEDAAAAVDDAVAAYALVEAGPEDVAVPGGEAPPEDADRLLAVGPAAFPTLPHGAVDLPHMLSVPERTLDRASLAGATLDRLRADAEAAIEAGDRERAARLLEVSYDLEAWGPVDAGDVRDRLDALLHED